MGRLILLSFFCVAVLVACGGGGEEVLPTAVPPADATAAPDSPRITETPDPGLPPTWTPVPAGDRGHLPGAAAPGDESGEGGTSSPAPRLFTSCKPETPWQKSPPSMA
jgi:predicted small lipoprotein YifL